MTDVGPAKIRIVIAEDNELMRTGVVSVLNAVPHFWVVAQVADGQQAILAYRTHRPDVLLLDLRMPVMDGLQVIHGVIGEFPDAKILMLTSYDGSDLVFSAVRAGARGYLTKDLRGSEVVRAIERVAAGEKFLPSSALESINQHAQLPVVTLREKQVLELLAEGAANKLIATRLGLSPRTVEIYVSRILDKLGVSNRTEAVGVAIRRGLMTRDK